MSRRRAERDSLPTWTGTPAAYGALVYLLIWAVCVVVMFGYEEQWTGPYEAFYTLGSVRVVERVAFLVGQCGVTFPAWPTAWFSDSLIHPVGAMASGAIVGGVAVWVLDRRESMEGRPAETTGTASTGSDPS